MSVILSLWTVVAFVIFLAIVWWAWNPANKAEFESAARVALEDADRESTDA